MNETQAPKGRVAGFFTSLGGILTAIAAFIGAIAAVLALFVVPGDSSDGGSSRADWANEVDPICSEATNAVRSLPISTSADANAVANYFRQVGGIARDMGDKVRAVDAPAEDQGNVDRMTLLIDQQADSLDAAANAVETQDQQAFASAEQQANTAEAEADALANSLGVSACAQAIQPTLTP